MTDRRIEGVGPSPATIALVGEAPGLNETIYGRPFVGEAGQELDRMLADAGLSRKTCYATNVFKIKPPDTARSSNDIKEFFVSRTHPLACHDLPSSSHGYLRSDLLPMVRELIPELVNVGARVVVALGNTALWALLGQSKISSYVGTVHGPAPGRPFTVIPTYHPSAVIRQWAYRTTVVANLQKVAELVRRLPAGQDQPVGPGVSAPPKQLLTVKVNPTLSECQAFAERAFKAPLLAVDVETAHGQIRTISFALSPTSAFTIPFWEPPAPSYWPTLGGEVAAWECVRRALSGPGTKVFHNGAYDVQYLLRVHGITIHGPIEDTMIAHHSMEPELPKSLGGLSAIYLHIPEWKTMRLKSEKDGQEKE